MQALADPNYNEAMPLIEKYQNLVVSKNHEFIKKFDNKFNKTKIESTFLEEANKEIVDFVKKETNKLLKEILYISSLKMKNSFSKSDT